jgi:hypothetical protein
MLLGHRQDRTTTDHWQPIRRIGRPRIDARASELFNIRVTLAATPPSDWHEAFIQFENGVARSAVMFENPSLVGNAISLRGVREKDVDFWFDLIDTKIAGANVQYTERTPSTPAAVGEREVAEAHRQGAAQVRADEIARRWEAPDA